MKLIPPGSCLAEKHLKNSMKNTKKKIVFMSKMYEKFQFTTNVTVKFRLILSQRKKCGALELVKAIKFEDQQTKKKKMKITNLSECLGGGGWGEA